MRLISAAAPVGLTENLPWHAWLPLIQADKGPDWAELQPPPPALLSQAILELTRSGHPSLAV